MSAEYKTTNTRTLIIDHSLFTTGARNYNINIDNNTVIMYSIFFRTRALFFIIVVFFARPHLCNVIKTSDFTSRYF